MKEKCIDGLISHASFPIHTGKLEGFNNRIKVAKRIGCGYWEKAWFPAAKERGIPSLVRFATLKEKCIDGLISHASFPIRTGKLEGFNNKIKVAKRIGYGDWDDDFFFLIVSVLSSVA